MKVKLVWLNLSKTASACQKKACLLISKHYQSGICRFKQETCCIPGRASPRRKDVGCLR